MDDVQTATAVETLIALAASNPEFKAALVNASTADFEAAKAVLSTEDTETSDVVEADQQVTPGPGSTGGSPMM